MVKIWAKLIKDDKIIKSLNYTKDELYDINHFPIYLMEICERLNISVPVIVSKHIRYFYLFNTTTYDIEDFVGESDFDKLVLESAMKD